MKRKFTFFGICVLICSLMISLGSCQKDYSEDIADLQAQITANQNAITALNTAIASGKLIKTVTTTSTGYTITFSDNSTISLNHGTNGTPGATGPAGPAGPAGATGFTPIIGIDADGYWTVVTTQGGTPARILVGGQPVYAKFTTDQFGANAQGFITINGVATSVYVPIIAYNDVTKKIQVTIKNTDGTFTTYNVAVDEDTFLKSDLVSVVSPIGTTKIKFNYGYVPANTAAGRNFIDPVGPGTVATVNTALAFAGVSYDALLRAEGKIPVIINPAQAILTGYTFDVIKRDGTKYALQPEAGVLPENGFSGAFHQFAAAPSNGLYTITIKAANKAAAIAAEAAANYPTAVAGYPAFTSATGETFELAVRATKGGREVISGYQYAVQVKEDVATAYTWDAAKVVAVNPAVDPLPAAYPWKAYVAIGTTKDLLDFYQNTTFAPVMLKSTDFYKSAVSIVATPGNSDVEGFVTIAPENATTRSRTTVSTANTAVTVTNLNDRVIPFKLQTFDWRGQYFETKGLSVVFYSALNNTLVSRPQFNYVLRTDDPLTPAVDERQVTVLLAEPSNANAFFSQLDAVGKTELWRTQATNVEVQLTYGTPAVAIPGVTYEYLDANNNVIVDAGDVGAVGKPIFTTAAEIQKIRKIRFTFNEATALPNSLTGMPANYNAVLKFTDRRAYATASSTYTMPFTISNPDISATLNQLIEKKPNLFDGNLLTVYGTYPTPGVYAGATAQTDATNAYYDLWNAYKNLYDPALAPAAQLVPLANWQFIKTGTTPTLAPANPLIAGIGVLPTNTDRFRVLPTTMYTNIPYDITLRYYHFGNVLNFVNLETIKVQAKSEVREGRVLANAAAKPAGWALPTTLEVINGDLVRELPLSFYFKAEDYLGFNLKAFGRDAANAIAAAVDTRIDAANVTAPGVASVKVLNTSANAHLVSVTAGHAGAGAGVIATAAIPANPLDFTVKATNAVAVIQSDVVVPLTVEITDIFGKKLTGTINVTVKKP
jgi:hypothetical protein